MNIGIDRIAFAVPRFYLDLSVLAAQHGIDPDKYRIGIGQEKMAIAPHDEDVVTLACKAAAPIVQGQEALIDTVLFATESGIDQSKAAGIYLHRLLALNPHCRVVELKQACYSATAALQLASAYVMRYPAKKVLLVASDIAKYDLNTPAEATQGAAAVAMLIAAEPRIAQLEPLSASYTEDVMDFWRPHHRLTPLLDGRFSTLMYLKTLEQCYKHYLAQGGDCDFAAYCYHLPFVKMGMKAHERLRKLGAPEAETEAALHFSRVVGNAYSASLYLSLLSLWTHRADLDGQRIACFSYGSGAVGEFFTLKMQPHYAQHLDQAGYLQQLQQREALDYARYLHYWQPLEEALADSGSGSPRFLGVQQQQRQYA